MNNKLRLLIILGLVISTGAILFLGCASEKFGFEERYLGQTAPGRTPEIFALGTISSKDQEHSSLSFSPDGREIMWSLWQLPHDFEKYPQVIKYIACKDNQWSQPAVVPFLGVYRDGGPSYSPDGNRVYFYSRRPVDTTSESMNDNDIWYVERETNGWSKPANLGGAVNTDFIEVTPCLASNGNLYFTSDRNQYEDSIGNNDIFVSNYNNGVFEEPVSVSDKINTAFAREAFPYIAPDESYLIFSRDDRKFDSSKKLIAGKRRLMISFRQENGLWSQPVNMGKNFETGRFPSVSPDGKYLFFTKYSENTSEDIYWVDATIIDELRRESGKEQ